MKKPFCRFAATFFIVASSSCARVSDQGKGVGVMGPGPDAAAVDAGSVAPDTSVPSERPTAPASDARDASITCQDLCTRQMTCPGGGDTTISGTVHAPTPPRFGAADPLYNVLVYVPNAVVTPFVPGVKCERCERASGAPLITALTGPDGTFTLKNAPVGANIPLVIQIGRWRRQVTIPNVAACANTALPDELTRLPRNKSEGDIPAIAIATGVFDPFDCTLRKLGIDEAEFTNPIGTGRVHMWSFGGNKLPGGVTPVGDLLMDDLPTMSKYDLVLLPCDSPDDRPRQQLDNLRAYTAKGGRVFLTDWGYAWLKDGGAFNSTVNWMDDTPLGTDFTVKVDTTFPKGVAFSAWLSVVGAARPTAGQLPVHDPYLGMSVVETVVAPTQRWLYTEGAVPSIQHLTFNAPVGAPDDQQCGRVVFSQFHVADSGSVRANETFPRDCDNNPMTPQEKALEFMLFDLSSCVMPDNRPPVVVE